LPRQASHLTAARSALVGGLTLALAVLIPLAVAAARVYRGMHFLADVVGGTLLGGAWLAATVQDPPRGGPLAASAPGSPPELTASGDRL
jgi:membrane-associated phospholipid phosphatase